MNTYNNNFVTFVKTRATLNSNSLMDTILKVHKMILPAERFNVVHIKIYPN